MVTFQLTSWHDEDLHADDLSAAETAMLPPEVPDEELFPGGFKRRSEPYQGRHYVVTAFGRAADGRSVAVRLFGFQPFVYARVGSGAAPLRRSDAESVLRVAREISPKREVRGARVVARKDYYGFAGNETRDFVGVQFLTRRAARGFGFRVAEHAGVRSSGGLRRLHPYEAHIEPLLRLIHVRGLDAAGWVEVDPGSRAPGSWARTDLCYSVPFGSIGPAAVGATVAPVVTASFDLECVPLNLVDFPKPRNDYAKVADDLRDLHGRAVGLRWPPRETRLLVRGAILRALGEPLERGCADLMDRAVEARVSSGSDVSRVFPKARGDASLLAEKVEALAEDLDEAFRAPEEEGSGARAATVAGAARLIGAHLPSLRGDEVVQIGCTFNLLGREEPSRRWIGVVGGCDDVPGAEVARFGSEAELVLAFAELVRSADPDVVMGYNIWGFDWFFLYARAEELGVARRFLASYSRLGHAPALYQEKELSSSAMGTNHNMFVVAPGRVNLDLIHVMRKEYKFTSYSLNNVSRAVLKDEKDDVSAQDIFRLQGGTDADRAVVARYCVQDCALVTRLAERLNVLVNSMAMASVCSVPLQYIFSRGQGIKCTSQVARECRARGYLMKTHPPADESEPVFFDGARVLEPRTGLYDRPVFCLDYASLYPSCMISHNICASSKVVDPRYLGLPGYRYHEVSFNVYKDKKKVGVRTVHFAQPLSEERAVLPAIEETLKRKRSETRAKMKWKRVRLGDGRELTGAYRSAGGRVTVGAEEVGAGEVAGVEDFFSDFEKSVLNGEQLAYKVTGNSLYGAQGASTSDIRDLDCAAAITAVGRSLLELGKNFLEEEGCEVVYGDTDSCFATVPVFDAEGREVRGPAAVPLVARRARELEEKIGRRLPAPHVLEFEKLYTPFVLLSKKRYLGLKYEGACDEPRFSYNGIVLVRRDNCEALKDVVTRLCMRVLEMDIAGAVDELRAAIDDLVEGRVPLEKLTITKTLGDGYKNPGQIAHWVLSQRIGRRDPARRPRSNDRVAYAFVENSDRKALQGDRIETPEFIRENKLAIDYGYYLEHQIVTPVCQILAAAVERLPFYRLPEGHWDRMRASRLASARVKHPGDGEAAQAAARKQVDDEKAAVVRRMVFDPILSRLSNRRANQREITSFFCPE